MKTDQVFEKTVLKPQGLIKWLIHLKTEGRIEQQASL